MGYEYEIASKIIKSSQLVADLIADFKESIVTFRFALRKASV